MILAYRRSLQLQRHIFQVVGQYKEPQHRWLSCGLASRCIVGATKNESSHPTLQKISSKHHRNIQRTVRKINKKTKRDTLDMTSRDNILILEIKEALEALNPSLTLDDTRNSNILIESFIFSKSRPLVELNNIEIIYQTSEGDGLSIIPKLSYVTDFMVDDKMRAKYTVIKIPKTLVGDTVKVRMQMHHNFYAEAELLEVLNTSSKTSRRKDDLIVCDKFSNCSGCQFQMLDYEYQLEIKRGIIEKAYRFFYPELSQTNIENFGATIGSPMQYSYRTKLTPHYELLRSTSKSADVNIGFNHVVPNKGIIDVDNCPIASPPINKDLPRIRQETKIQIEKELETQGIEKKRSSMRGSTLLLRDSLRIDHETGEYERVCLSQHKNIITEKIEGFVFQFPASEFFQNNNNILPEILEYIRYQIQNTGKSFKYIVDTYCGSGFFGIALSKDIPENGKVFGIEVSKLSIEYAKHNAKLNGLAVPEKIQYIEGNANAIFTNNEFIQSGIEGGDSIVIMDPSRKGSNKMFMEQLLDFQPKLIVYVSCNVFTQARDLADF